jgi:hypothetical protein
MSLVWWAWLDRPLTGGQRLADAFYVALCVMDAAVDNQGGSNARALGSSTHARWDGVQQLARSADGYKVW